MDKKEKHTQPQDQHNNDKQGLGQNKPDQYGRGQERKPQQQPPKSTQR